MRNSPVGVIGIGRDRKSALEPFRVDVRGTRIAFLAADASPREGSSTVWSAGTSTPGIVRAREDPRALVAAVQAARSTADVVVVYLHWGTENRACPDPTQHRLAATLARAGADVVVGSHAHVLQGAGFRGDTYVSYGLGNFLWYHDRVRSTGVLQVHIEDGEVVGDTFAPAEISTSGRPSLVHGPRRAASLRSWERLRACTGLDAAPR
jgi:poly-gamma-glutamate synthesis protein (capsule biosynthesis protein)